MNENSKSPNKALKEILCDDATLTETELTRILSKTDDSYSSLFEAMRYSIMSGGKRIRPTLTIEFCRMLGGNMQAAVALAAALEMVHTYSLIHDDLPCMDNDDLRRGKPTNHKVYGEATATLAGDGLLTHAFYVIATCPHLSAENAVKAVKTLSECAGIYGMVGGQQMDMDGEISEKCGISENDRRPNLGEHEKMNRLKTGKLIKCACIFGCIATPNADKAAFEAAEKYADGIGLAFQITDDILDMGEEEQKTTFLSFYSEDEARKLAKSLTEKSKDAVKPYKNNEILLALADLLLDRSF